MKSPQDSNTRDAGVNTDLTLVGRISRAHGLRGEFRVQLITAHPEHLSSIESVYLKFEGAQPTLYTIERSNWNGSRLLFKFHGVDDRNTAEALRDAEMYISGETAYKPGEDEYFVDDLIGLRVIDTEGNRLGKIIDVLSFPAHDVYVISRDEKEVLVPAVSEYVKDVDIDTGTITITVVDGLLD